MKNANEKLKDRFINWSEDYEINNKIIDEDHKLFLQLVNDFYSALKTGKAIGKIEETINELQAYAQSHFKTEEALLKQINCPKINEHIDTHKTFKITVNELEKRYASGDSINTLVFDIMNFMKNWFQNHILTKDKQIENLIKKEKMGEMSI